MSAPTERELREAHERGDHDALATLYARAGDAAETAGDIDAACFFLTQAWVFAMQAGRDDAETLRARLAARGRA